jgi:hypothetical protein
MASAEPRRLPIPPPPECLSQLLDISPMDWNCPSRVNNYLSKGAQSYSPAPFVYVHYAQSVISSDVGRQAKGVHIWYNALQGTCQTTPPTELVEVEWVHQVPWQMVCLDPHTLQSRWTLEGCDEKMAVPLVCYKLPPLHHAEGVRMQPSQPSSLIQPSQLSQLTQAPAVAVAACSASVAPSVMPALVPCEAKSPSEVSSPSPQVSGPPTPVVASNPSSPGRKVT